MSVPRERRLAVLRILSVAAFFGAWLAVTGGGLFTPFLLPSPVAVLLRLRQEFLSGELLVALRVTLLRMFGGYLLAALVGIPLGVGLARLKAVRWFFDPLLSLALPMPQVAFLPIFILWLGVFDASKVALIAFSAVFPIIVQSWAGTQSIDKYLTWSALSLGVGPRALLWDIVLPAALPQIFTGLQVALPIALITAVVTEMLMGGNGLGGSIISGMRFSNSPQLFAGIVAVGLVGYLMTKAMELLRRALLAWHQEALGG